VDAAAEIATDAPEADAASAGNAHLKNSHFRKDAFLSAQQLGLTRSCARRVNRNQRQR